MIGENEIFARSELLLGAEGLRRLASKRVIVFGVGGVGSWCAEALVRSGVRHLTIVDADRVCASNINRQLMATVASVGRPKVDALRERLLEINPSAEVEARQELFSAPTLERFDLAAFDYVIDAIDSVADKALLITEATRSGARLFSSMGAALKLDPSRVRTAEFWRVEGDALARALRRRFRRDGIYPSRKFTCVFSDEQCRNIGVASVTEEPSVITKRQTNGSLVHITATFGMALAGLVIRDATA